MRISKAYKIYTHTQISNSNSSFAEKMIMAQEKIGANFNGNAAKFAVWCLTISNDKANGIKEISVEILVISIVSFYLAVTMCFRTLFQCFNIGFHLLFRKFGLLSLTTDLDFSLLISLSTSLSPAISFRLILCVCVRRRKLGSILCEMEFCNNFCCSLCSVLFHCASSIRLTGFFFAEEEELFC